LDTTSFRAFLASAVLLASSGLAFAQSPSAASQATPPPTETRPATTTFDGETGIWFVPTAEILPAGMYSVSGYRRGTNYIEGYTNVGDFAGTFGYGIKDRAEVFGSFLFDTRIDRDVRPIFVNDPTYGGIVSRYPRVNQPWTGDNVGDLYLGAKFNLWSEYQQKPVALALRGLIKLPTASADKGIGTGKVDGSIDFIVSKELQKMVEMSGFAGWQFLGQPDNFDAPSGAFEYGFGVAVPSRKTIRLNAEYNGYAPNKSTITYTGPIGVPPVTGTDLSFAPITSNVESLQRATIGVTYQSPKGFFAGVGLSWNFPTQARILTQAESDQSGDYVDWQVRVGWHPGVRQYVAPVVVEKCNDRNALNFGEPAPCRYPPQAAVHNLTVKADCGSCSVEIGQSIAITATAQDSQGCSVTYRWSAPSGAIAQPTDRQTRWTAGQTEGSVPVTVTVTCPTDNKTASDTVNIAVTRPPVKQYTFEDVHFDFDRYTLRPEATRVLDEAVAAMRENPTLRLTIEGHTCSIGTAEYNLALGDRRANAVKDYLTSRGIGADRLTTISYGEERPKYDNSREETRRLNRRAALVVRLQ
jgi:outer membrane protein OmpA-like peptidoglycan-associated protein